MSEIDSLQTGVRRPRQFLGAGALCAFTVVSFFSSSCGSTPPRPMRPEQFLPLAEQVPEGAHTGERPPVSIYVDGSGSMKGFAADPASDYLRLLSALLGKATGSYDAQIYKFTSEFTPVGHMAFSQMQTPDFYNGLWTPLSELFNRIAREHQAGPRISVLVSDLVQSERLRDHTDLMRSLRQLTQTRQEVLLLGFRSHFAGMYETETYPKKTYRIDATRPFYALIIAPDAESLLQFRRDVLYGISELQKFHPSHPLGSVDAAKYAPKDPNRRTWNLHKAMELGDAPSGPKRLLAYFRDRNVYQAEQGHIQIELTFDGSMQLKDSSAVAFSVSKGVFPSSGGDRRKTGSSKPAVSWESVKVTASLTRKGSRTPGSTSKESASAPGSQGVLAAGSEYKPGGAAGGKESPTSKPQAVFLAEYGFPRPAKNSWDVYRIHLRPGQGNLATPAWVEEWSTDNDQSPERGDRTLHLDFFVDALLKGVAEDLVFSEQYFLLGRGNQ